MPSASATATATEAANSRRFMRTPPGVVSWRDCSVSMSVMRLISACFLWALSALPAGAAGRPNILYIMSDDHAAHAIGAYGSHVNTTPNLDRIAREGAILTNVFVTNSICTPSRAAILTGQYSHLNGVKTLDDAIDPKKIHLAHLLREAGYQT